MFALGSGGATLAETPMDGAAFERYTTGRTLSFNAGGVPYGIEQYLPGRRVLWAFIGQECQEGIWYERGDMICFAYEDYPEDQCWHFFETDRGLRAVFQGPDGPSTELVEVEQSSVPLICEGPGVGV
ncbi:MAG: hypothetical protein JJU19_08130 [Pararhodobacter sp.]|nr:hypothetical protein [Pararhodobacter sp.]